MWSSKVVPKPGRMPTLVRRRDAIRFGLASAGLALSTFGLAGCGFRLRGDAHFAFKNIRLGFAPRSPMGAELERQLLRVEDVHVVQAEKDAEVVMEVLIDRVDRVAGAATSVGQVREINITTKLRFRARTPAGKELIPETELALAQSMTYSEEQAQAKESEEAQIVQGMRRDLAAQVLRRLEAVKL